MQNSIRHFDLLAPDYDTLSKAHKWYAPEALFGLTYQFKSRGQTLLDMGIGTGQSSALDHKAGLKIYGIDGSQAMLDVCAKKAIAIKLVHYDFASKKRFPFKKGMFDHVISCGVFNFFEDLDKFFKEAQRLLRQRGIFAFTVEDPKIGYDLKYTNYDNDLMTERIIDKVGVEVFRHPEFYIQELALKYGFNLLRTFQYLAYHSPTESKDIFYKQYVFFKDERAIKI